MKKEPGIQATRTFLLGDLVLILDDAGEPIEWLQIDGTDDLTTPHRGVYGKLNGWPYFHIPGRGFIQLEYGFPVTRDEWKAYTARTRLKPNDFARPDTRAYIPEDPPAKVLPLPEEAEPQTEELQPGSADATGEDDTNPTCWYEPRYYKNWTDH